MERRSRGWGRAFIWGGRAPHARRRGWVAGLVVEVGPSAGDGAEVAGVGEHLYLGHLGLHDLSLAALLDAHGAPAAAREVAHHVADELGRREHLHLYVRLEEDGAGVLDGVLEGHGARDLEGHLRGVDRVEGAVVEADLHVHDRVAGDHALAHRLLHTLLDGRYELARYRAADYRVLELEPRAAGERGALEPRAPHPPPPPPAA